MTTPSPRLDGGHTPGPWEWDIYARGYVLVGAPRPGSSARQPVKITHAHADGRLIAAAPDLLAALEAMMELHGCDLDEIKARRLAASAITRARGKDHA